MIGSTATTQGSAGTGAARYDKAAATLAWERTIAIFDESLKGA
jgi:hypothetical protein